MHPIIEAGIMKTRTRPRRTAGRTRLVWRGLPDRAARALRPLRLPRLLFMIVRSGRGDWGGS